jgi:ArsR family transcriptional regulator
LTGAHCESYISQEIEMADDAIPVLADRMQALASATRLRILLVLRDGALCVCQIAAVLDVPASTVSSHLSDLRRAGIVGEHRKGRFVWYALRRHDDVIPWLRLVARQSTDDPQVAADHARAARIRLVPPEMLVASTDCDAGTEMEAARRRSSALGAA